MDSKNELSQVKSNMTRAMALIKEAVDTSLPLLKNEQKRAVIHLWEKFLGEFFFHVKKKGRESGSNLFSHISLWRIRAK
ncbi:hypothetical protein IT084_04390 [Desulfallas sp. Bu1-1]|uniref:hypothetical protein n=1 Tax=Desulfallas sp. Bu1-1 TaxID=2787620 RepID=UPI00189F5218|nr:hypothetical protein [Desulfallas sp. Bu1-1]MBF7082213.1 hypothetical protein [Desulfallas sp. Bu1-1]